MRQSSSTRARADRRAANTRPISSPSTTSCASPAARTSSARAAARPPIRPSASASASPRSIRSRTTSCSSASSRPQRNEPPDIDVDFEHERREEVIQYIYRQIRPRRAPASPPPSSPIAARSPSAMSARPSACRRTRSARSPASIWGWAAAGSRGDDVTPRRARRRRARACARCCELVDEICRLPAPPVAACRRLRHHPRAGSTSWCRSMNARDGGPHPHRMGQGRSRRARHPQGRRARRSACSPASARLSSLLEAALRRRRSTLADRSRRRIPPVYDMLQPRRFASACSRSRAARRCRCCRGCKPQEFYDLVIEVAIVRPGPDPGRHGASLSAPPAGHREGRQLPVQHGAATTVLKKTLGVPLFQEQAMKIAIVAGGLHAGGSRQAAPRHGDLQAHRHHRHIPATR